MFTYFLPKIQIGAGTTGHSVGVPAFSEQKEMLRESLALAPDILQIELYNYNLDLDELDDRPISPEFSV